MFKLKFWKKEPSVDFDKLKQELDVGAFGGQDQLGLGMDRTAGLGGTESIHSSSPLGEPDLGPDVIRGKQDYLRELPSSQQRSPLSGGSDVLLKDVEIISSKLDTIKAMVESINQRLEQLERSSRDAYKRW